MLGWIFKKTDDTPAADAKPEAAATAPGAGPAKEQPDDTALWQARLAAAAGDDAALLDIARQAPSITVKCAAVGALVDEAALKQAEREFRTHDRRVHRSAKQRHDAAVARRLARERAGVLLDSATALLAEATIPTNRLVELDRAWQALDPALLADEQKAQFAELSARLTQLTQERGERELQAQHWLAAGREALVKLDAACAGAATGATEPGDLARATAAAAACGVNTPDSGPATALQASLQQALRTAADIEARLELLHMLQQSPPVAPAADEPPAADPPPAALVRWQALPPLADAPIAAALNRRFEQWQASVAAALRAAAAEKVPPRKVAQQTEKRERAQVVEPRLQQAEAALEGGNLAETHRHLVAVDAAVAGGMVPEPLRARLQAVQTEYARLKGWQHWGGGRVRDDLVQEAQTLATATTAAVADPRQAAKLPVKQLADAIDDLRKRWKELDRLGGATNQSLWHSFDAALKTAFEPVAAHLDQLKAKRKENLAARLQLIAELDAVRVDGGEGVAQAGPEDQTDDLPDQQTTDWREPARALAHFQTEWRKLGPVEHTVPHKARDALVTRMQASVARVEAPLNDARRAAQQVREQLVARAKALSDEAAASPHGRDLVPRVRELQEQWQQHARTLPLMRQVETALWAEFKAATDAVFAQRDAAFNARDAELLANLAARDALVARLEGLTADTPAGEFKRALAQIDAEWRQPVDVPRHQVAGLDARFRAARQAAQQVLAGSAQRVRQARFDALTTRLTLCEELERQVTAGAAVPDDLAQRWAAQAAPQAAWEQALAQRWQRSTEAEALAAPAPVAAALDATLLQLESALDVPSPPAFQTARRDMKLQAMKAALESRSATRAATAGVDELMEAALRYPQPTALQSERLHALVAALRATDHDRS